MREPPEPTDTQTPPSDSPTPPRTIARRRRPGQQFETLEARRQAQDTFLQAFSMSANVRSACLEAGINRDTVYDWRKRDKGFAARFAQAEEDANDVLLAEGWRRAVQGVEKPVVSAGRLVYDEEPDLDDQGEQRRDRQGRPLYRRGRMMTVREYSDPIWLALAKSRIPAMRERSAIELSGKDGKPLETSAPRVVFVLPEVVQVQAAHAPEVLTAPMEVDADAWPEPDTSPDQGSESD